jgi:antitoxin component YwqK of YwqJK toxin-antitoxin module
MKSIFAIILTIILLFGCKTEVRETVETFPNGKVKSEYVYSNKENKNNYTIIDYFENGQVKFKGTVKDGKFVGAKLNYYENGNLSEVDSIINPCVLDFCCCDGTVFKYFRNGKLDQTYEIRNGVANGLVTIYDRDSLGRVILTTEYKDDKKNGIEIDYFESGSIYSISEFKNDTVVNYIYYFKENGDTSKYFFHFKGKQDFPVKKWLENGQIFYAAYIDSSYKKVLYRWTDKGGNEIKREIITPDKNKKYALPD